MRIDAYEFSKRFSNLVRDARRHGVVVVADADGVGVRFVDRQDVNPEDMRGRGEFVAVDTAVGGGDSVNLELSCRG